MSRFTNPVPQFYLNDGSIASSGKLFFYENGTTTKKDTWNAPEGAPGRAKNTNPVVLDGNGRCPNIFGEGRYTVVFVSSDDAGNVQQWTRDYVELSVQLGQYSDWSPILTYRINDIVRGSDGNYYRSVFNNNTGSDPVSSASRWERIGFITYWNTNATYGNGDLVVFGDALYRSGEDENQGNQPDQSSTTVWKNTVEPSQWLSGVSYQEGELVVYESTVYRSLSNNNQGNQPDASGDWDNVFGESQGAILQEVVATSTANDITSSTTFQDTSLSASITPLRSNSVIEAVALVTHAAANRASGEPISRAGLFRIRNVTDDVSSGTVLFGRDLEAGSSDPATSRAPVPIVARFAVDSTAERTIQLQFRAYASGTQVLTAGTSGGPFMMTLREIAQ